MPLYEYKCNDCGHHFELLRSMSKADEPAQCPYCGSSGTSRLISPFAAVSRGEGGESKPLTNPCAGCTATTCTSCNR
ncbi:MAG: zinc ribbon domain-containing protein [Chloroflexi bacterium]|nr:MAG: zinc ribbon domain-containing protein [Chloroflexota bacterium]HDN80030.1 zinc ribbon domain-containing protein [Chloroflexota bacterium]